MPPPWPQISPGVIPFVEKLENCSVPVIAASLDKPETHFYYDPTAVTWKVRHDHGDLITPLLSTSNLAPTVKTHFERQCSHHWSLPHTYHSNNTESKFSSGVAGLSDLASLQVLCQKIELFFLYIKHTHFLLSLAFMTKEPLFDNQRTIE